ncbi:MAG: hypothetical protein ACM32H_07175, partial [Candidatus Aminicenantes bacterium RBG_16_66_30]
RGGHCACYNRLLPAPITRKKRGNEVTVGGPARIEAAVECYAGYKGDETPRALIIGKVRLEIVEILSRRRVLDQTSGLRRDVWRCRLADGRKAVVERLDDGTWRVSAAA